PLRSSTDEARGLAHDNQRAARPRLQTVLTSTEAAPAHGRRKRAVNDVQYELTLQRLMMCAELLVTLDLDGFLGRIEACEAVGPLMDSTRWMELSAKGATDALRKVKNVARAARELQRVFREAWPERAARIETEVANG
ncbi:MAG: hypothetical protein ACM3VX_06185, partial [Bacteroidota bacterium]